MYKGQPLLLKSPRLVVVYDGGGAEGSPRIRYYNPRIQRVHITSSGNLETLDRVDFDPKALIFKPWDVIIDPTLWVKNSKEGIFSYDNTVPNLRDYSKLPSLTSLPSGEWHNHYHKSAAGLWVCPDKGTKKCRQVKAEKCRVDIHGNVYMDGYRITIKWGDSISIEKDGNYLLPKDHEVFEYDPEEEPSVVTKRAIIVVRALVDEYQLFIKGVRPTRPVLYG